MQRAAAAPAECASLDQTLLVSHTEHADPRRGAARAIQRARIIDAMALTLAQHGFENTTVAAVCAAAGVSRASFYRTFAGLQDCFTALHEEGFRRGRALIAAAFDGEERWRDGVRAALGALLAMLDDEPHMARALFVETLAAGRWALDARSRHITALTTLIGGRWPMPEGADVNPLAVTAIIESVFGLIHSHLLASTEEPLVGLLGQLMGVISGVYDGPRSSTAEIARGEAHARALLVERRSRSTVEAPDVEIPRMLRDPRAGRARACLLYVAEASAASNQDVARAVGIRRQEQISRLLGRLATLGLIVKRPGRPGTANAWSLTVYGQQVSDALGAARVHSRAVPPTLTQGTR